MQIRKLEVHNFRGIQSLDWNIKGSLICLIGKGDSTKTTILQAIWYALYPNWNLSLYDTDFYDQNTDNPIQILVTVGELSQEIIRDFEQAQRLRGWNLESGLVDEPDDGLEDVITLRLTVDKTLEPVWETINDRSPAEKISHATRSKLSTMLLGDYAERELSWTRGSSLSRSTGELEGSNQVIVDATRQMKGAVASMSGTPWSTVCDELRNSATDFGVNINGNLQPGVDTRYFGMSTALRLFDGNIPISLYGQGSKRLFLASLKSSSRDNGSILLADEIENGLEPHRLRHFIRKLRPAIPSGAETTATGQTIFTTHSEIAIVECKAEEIKIVRCDEGNVTILDIPVELSSFVRKYPEALLGRKVVVCEGDTEYGFCRALDNFWEESGGPSFSLIGIVPIDVGGRTQVGKCAMQFKELGYNVAVLADSDDDLDIDDLTLESENIKVVRWADNCTIEERIIRDLPIEILNQLLSLVLSFGDLTQEKLIDQLKTQIPNHPTIQSIDIQNLLSLPEMTEELLRISIAKASVAGNGWFKRTDKGELLGNLVCSHLNQMVEKDIYTKLDMLKSWSHE